MINDDTTLVTITLIVCVTKVLLKWIEHLREKPPQSVFRSSSQLTASEPTAPPPPKPKR